MSSKGGGEVRCTVAPLPPPKRQTLLWNIFWHILSWELILAVPLCSPQLKASIDNKKEVLIGLVTYF